MNIKKWTLSLVPVLVLMVLGYFLWQGLGADPHQVPSSMIGRKVPKFSAERLYYPKQRKDETVFHGKVTILNVFSSWCLYCRTEHPMLMDIHRLGLVQMVGIDYKDKRKKAMAWLKDYGNPYHLVLFDPHARIAMQMGVYGTPETFVIDQQGTIRYRVVGPLSPDQWESSLLPLIHSLLDHQ